MTEFATSATSMMIAIQMPTRDAIKRMCALSALLTRTATTSTNGLMDTASQKLGNATSARVMRTATLTSTPNAMLGPSHVFHALQTPTVAIFGTLLGIATLEMVEFVMNAMIIQTVWQLH